MKTPRDILLERHQSAGPKLDEIRQEIIREGRRVAVPKFRVADTTTLPVLIWRELIFPSRRIWASLATVWIFIFIANVSQRDHSQITIAKSSQSSEMVLSFRQQEKLLAELIGQIDPREAESPKTFLPQPRSERRFEILTT